MNHLIGSFFGQADENSWEKVLNDLLFELQNDKGGIDILDELKRPDTNNDNGTNGILGGLLPFSDFRDSAHYFLNNKPILGGIHFFLGLSDVLAASWISKRLFGKTFAKSFMLGLAEGALKHAACKEAKAVGKEALQKGLRKFDNVGRFFVRAKGGKVIENFESHIEEMKRIGVRLELDADQLIGINVGKTKNATFDYENGIIYLRKGATEFEMFHEATHAKQWAQLGKKNYEELGEFAREKHVYDEIIANSCRFSDDEIRHAKLYIEDLKKLFDAGSID